MPKDDQKITSLHLQAGYRSLVSIFLFTVYEWEANGYGIGHILSINMEMPAYTFKQWHTDHGPVLRVNLGAQEWVMVSDTDILQELLVHHGAASSSRPFVNYSSGHYALNKK